MHRVPLHRNFETAVVAIVGEAPNAGIVNLDVFNGQWIDDVNAVDDPVHAETAPVSVWRVMVDLAGAGFVGVAVHCC